jgi:PAS domain S-box-containing protein
MCVFLVFVTSGRAPVQYALNAPQMNPRLSAPDTTGNAQAVRQGETRLQAAADLVGLARYSWDPQTNAVDWDARLKALWGLPPDAEITYEIWRRGVHSDDLPRVEAAVAACIDPQDDGIYDIEYRVVGFDDGVERWIHTRGQTYFEAGRAIEFVGVALEITERKRTEADLIAAKLALSDELAVMNRLHELSTRLTSVADLNSLLLEVLDAVIELQNADFGDVQLYDAQSETLTISAQRGFGLDFLKHFQAVRADAGSACAEALNRRRRIIIEDVSLDPSFTPHFAAAEAAGFRAVQSTPLVAVTSTHPVGILSTYFRMPHRPTDHDLRLTDLYARQAADVIGSKLVEQRLREHEAQLTAILQHLPIGVGLINREGRFRMRGGLLGHLWASLMPSRDPTQATRWKAIKPDGQPLDASQYPGARALRGETIVPGIDFIHTEDDGRETWIRVAAVPFRDAAGEIQGAVATLENIDIEKRAEQTVRESEERFRHFAQHSSNVLWIFDVGSERLEYVSPAYQEVWGRAPRHLMSEWFQDVHDDDREAALAGFERAQLGESLAREYRITRPDGTVRWIRDTLFPIRDRRGHVTRVGGIAQDVTVYTPSLIYVIDYDEVSREKTMRLLQRARYNLKAFKSGDDFLQIASALAPGCILLNSSSPQTSIALLRQLKAVGSRLPVVVSGISGGSVVHAVQAMKAGAVDWVEIPFHPETLLSAVSSALSDIRMSAEQELESQSARIRIAGMSERERQVLEGLLAGGTNKTIARDLGISPRTVEMHRAGVMERLDADTLPQAVLLAAAAGIRPARRHRRPPRESP